MIRPSKDIFEKYPSEVIVYKTGDKYVVCSNGYKDGHFITIEIAVLVSKSRKKAILM